MTRREKDLSRERIERVMQLTAQGLGVTEICERLGIKPARLHQIRSRARQREKAGEVME